MYQLIVVQVCGSSRFRSVLVNCRTRSLRLALKAVFDEIPFFVNIEPDSLMARN